MKNAHDVAVEFNLRKSGKEFRGDCPLCQHGKLELSVWEKSDGFGCWCHYGCDGRELFRTLIDGVSPWPTVRTDVKPVSTEKTEWALWIWRETVRATGTLAELYLRSRGISLSLPEDIRFHPELKHTPSGQKLPAMVCAVRDKAGGLTAIHRTYLSRDGRKASVEPPKMTLGPVAGHAIRLASEIGDTLGIGEGIETTLSARQFSAMQWADIPVWAAVNAGNMQRLALPDGVSTVYIFRDNDPAGIRAALAAAERFHNEGRQVFLVDPPGGHADFNDSLRGQIETCISLTTQKEHLL